MTTAPGDDLRQKLAALDPASQKFAVEAVDAVLGTARGSGVSDVHLQPSPDGLLVRWRIDGVLHHVGTIPAGLGPNVVARLKVLSDLLTYKSDVPQEGRIRGLPGTVEMRVSTFPTLHGEKAVVRLFAASGRYERIEELGLPPEIARAVGLLLGETSGMILFTGPAGSGKTTTIYACLRELVDATAGRRSLTTLEDPIEVALAGVAQSQVNPAAGFTLETGLRSLMRQDPEVIAVGEIRDRPTAEVAFQASLTGHLVLTTFHAGSAAGAIGRLSDMGIEPYVIRSGVLAVVFQRLVRRLCSCARPIVEPHEYLGLNIERAFAPVGCVSCDGTGYRGRAVIAEMMLPDRPETARAILERRDVPALELSARNSGMVDRMARACTAVEGGVTSPVEVRRVLGFAG